MTEEWPILETVSSEEEARLIAGFLENTGVRCEVESLRFHQEPVNFGRLSEVRLRVPFEELEMARRLLAQLSKESEAGTSGEEPSSGSDGDG